MTHQTIKLKGMETFHEQNPDFDILSFDLQDQESVSKLNWKGSDKDPTLDLLKKYQRLLRIHPDPEIASILLNESHTAQLAAGTTPRDGSAPRSLDSAYAIASMSRDQFVKEYAPLLGEDGESKANEIHSNATGIKSRTIHLWANIHNIAASPYFRAMRINHIGDDIVNHYEGLPGYQEIFGSLDYCECKHCNSIFGPAAYFVDLMRIAYEKVTEPNKGTIPKGMSLEDRRPDLAKILLTCENTNQTIPYLKIVNERLEETIGKNIDSETAYKSLAQKYHPFELPFQLQLERIRIYLKRLKVELSDIYAALGAKDEGKAAESLGLSPEEWVLLATKEGDQAKIENYYGVSDLNELSGVNKFCKQTSLEIKQVRSLLNQNLSHNENKEKLSIQFFINQGLTDPLQIEAEGEKIKNLNNVALDKIHRFLRLATKLGWSYSELDWALHCVKKGAPELDKDALVGIAGIKELKERLHTTTDEVCRLFFDLKTYGLGEDATRSKAPFDQVFNGSGVKTYHPKDEGGAYGLNKMYTDDILRWKIGEANSKESIRVASGLGLRQDDLLILAEAIFKKGSQISLTIGNLSALYSHAKLASLLGIPITQYVKLLGLLNCTKIRLDIGDVKNIMDVTDRLRSSGLNVFELDYIVNCNVNPSLDVLYKEQDVDSWLKTLLILTKNTDEDEKSTIKTEEDEQNEEHEQNEKLIKLLASFFGSQTDEMNALLHLIGQSDGLSIFLDDSKREEAKVIIRGLSRWMLLVRKLRLTINEIDSIRRSVEKKTGAYGIENIKNLTATNVLDISRLKEIELIYGDISGYLISFIDAEDETIAAKVLSGITEQNEEQIRMLLGEFNDPKMHRLEKLHKISIVIELIKKTGTDVFFLRSLKNLADKSAKDWDEYKELADNLLSAVRARIATESWDELHGQMDGEIQERKRKALIGTALNELAKKEATKWIKNNRNLCEYLLIDVDMSGCAQISYIKEGLNAVQLYLNRCRERLEPGLVKLTIPDVWWEWMMNYRVWEANRKVFLYPENYIDPSHRRSKTKLFRDLENTLNQGDINNDMVETAYKKYLDDFAELAKLKYVDGFYCNISDETKNDEPVFFLFARTEIQPYSYYYIIQEKEGAWSEWNKIDVTINSEYVTPVYAFDRLLIFWAEVKNYEEDASGKKKQTHKASIKYTFYNFNSKWAQPQTLVEDLVIHVDGSEYISEYKDIFTDNLFDMDRLWWKKVYPLKIERGRYSTLSAGANKSEKIIILYGPMIDSDHIVEKTDLKPPNKTDSTPSTTQEFEAHLYQALKDLNLTKKYSYSGHFPIIRPTVIDNNLDIGFLINPDEFLFLHKESPKSSTSFRPEIDRSSSRLNLIESNHVIYDNCIAEQIADPTPTNPPKNLNEKSFASKEAGIEDNGSKWIYDELVKGGYINSQGKVEYCSEDLAKDLNDMLQGQPDQERKVRHVLGTICLAAGTPWLSAAMRARNYELFMIKNHPKAFVFKGEKEAFLLRDPKKETSSISRALFNSDTIFTSKSFISPGADIQETGSENIYNQLVNDGYLLADGRLNKDKTLENIIEYLKEILRGQPGEIEKVDIVANVMNHSSLFYERSFVSDQAGIQITGSGEIYKELQSEGYLDKNGRLNANTDFYDITRSVSEILSGQPNKEKMVRHVVDTLYQGSFPSSIGFFESIDKGCSICEFRFVADRLTTAAIHRLSSTLFTGGIDEVLSLRSQQIPVEPELPFDRFEFTDARVIAPQAIDGAQIDFSGAYGSYYWELFFHTPLLIANLFKTNLRFTDAERWFKFIFNPTLPEDPLDKSSFLTSTLGTRDSERVYTVLKNQNFITPEGSVSPAFTRETRLNEYLEFINEKQIESVKNILLNHKLSSPEARIWQFQPFRNQTLESFREQLKNANEIGVYNKDPFDPHAIARLRIGAYEKAVVMQYIDNLLKWGDSFFAQYTWESIVVANMLYVYAYNLLGERPQDLGKCSTLSPANFEDIRKRYKDDIPEFLIELEHEPQGKYPAILSSPFNEIDAYFCAPENVEFADYWDRVEDRLYKIRHCMNISGVKQPLPLFQPPVDPSQLVRAASIGSDVLKIAEAVGPEATKYRFIYILERAKYITATLSQLGSALLAALEKKDIEALELLRSSHEKSLLNMTSFIKEKQIEETNELIASLQESQKSAQKRHDHYSQLHDENLNALEISDLDIRAVSIDFQIAANLTRGISIAGYLAPNIFGLADGGMMFGEAINAGAQIADGTVAMMNQIAGLIGTQAQYVRRREDWGLQRDLANYDVEQIRKQTSANQVLVSILNRELEIHKKSIEQAGEYEDFIKTKFTGEDLYRWMVSRISTIYFQTYQIAQDMALSAQSAYNNELDRSDQFIAFDNWDNLRKGLLAGDGLMLSLNQMEKSFIQNNIRTLEIEKTVSLLHLDPVKFLEFKGVIGSSEKGTLSFELSEKIFDFDFPGHYCRKIKSISVTIPAVVGPYQNINATLIQNSNIVILKPKIEAVEHVIDPNKFPNYPEGSLRKDWLQNQQVALSRGVEDSGLFMLDFHDERYLPFEGTGAVSKWTLYLPPETNRLDFSSISDIIMVIHYTAKDGGSAFADQVKSELRSEELPYPYTLSKILDLKQAFPGEWQKFIKSPPQEGIQSISFALTDGVILPNLKDVALKTIVILLHTPEGTQISDKNNKPFMRLNLGDGDESPITVSKNFGYVDIPTNSKMSGICRLAFKLDNAPDELLAKGALNPEILLDIVVVITYQSNIFKKI